MADRRGLTAAIKALALDCCSACGIAQAEAMPWLLPAYGAYGPESRAAYIGRSARERADIRLWFPQAKSVLVCAFSYWSGSPEDSVPAVSPEQLKSWPLRYLKRKGPAASDESYRPARFALMRDYHKEAASRLETVLKGIQAVAPETSGRVFVDTAPVAEKPLARIAGLGFQGKNTLLVSRELGSYFVLGGIALSLDLEADTPQKENPCVGCERCLKACPTGALSADGLDISRCLAYWLSAAPEAMPKNMSAHAAGLIAGCDKCQEACPWNARERGPNARLHALPRREQL